MDHVTCFLALKPFCYTDPKSLLVISGLRVQKFAEAITAVIQLASIRCCYASITRLIEFHIANDSSNVLDYCGYGI